MITIMVIIPKKKNKKNKNKNKKNYPISPSTLPQSFSIILYKKKKLQ